MRNGNSKGLLRKAAMGVIVLFVTSTGAIAQSGGPRNLEELKAETQKRVDRNVAPAGGLKSEDAREALAKIHSLDRDEWAAAWSVIADRYASRAGSEESSDKTKAQQDYLLAWRYYSFARWPTPNSPGKQRHIRMLWPLSEIMRGSSTLPWRRCTFHLRAKRLSDTCGCPTAFVRRQWC
jgi:hypothetical protein